jgi:MerR family transcriptional regulator/heat shock protein HspR
MSGLSTETIIHYQEQGLIQPSPDAPRESAYDDETLHTLRRIDHLRRRCGVNDAGLRLILDLMHELERLRLDPRFRH